MNKTIIGLLVILVVIGGFFLFFNKSSAPVANEGESPLEATTPVPGQNTPESIVETENKVSVTYSSNGFSPKTITIKKGESVTFINESGEPMSVASDPHPSHSIYPEFDQYKSSEKGQKSFTFTFDKVGSWGYHDHLNSSNTGTVVVE